MREVHVTDGCDEAVGRSGVWLCVRVRGSVEFDQTRRGSQLSQPPYLSLLARFPSRLTSFPLHTAHRSLRGALSA